MKSCTFVLQTKTSRLYKVSDFRESTFRFHYQSCQGSRNARSETLKNRVAVARRHGRERKLSVIKARFSCILVNFTCRFEDSPSVPERSYEQSVDILGYYYASISHVSTNYPLNFYTLSIDNSFMKVLKNAKSEMPTMFHSILPSKLPMGRMLLQCPNTSMKG